MRVFTIGHSNQAVEAFIDLLTSYNIEVLVDVRSVPVSKYAKQFDKSSLAKTLPAAGIKYLYMGKELGGRPQGTEFYDESGRALYSLVAQSGSFKEGVARLMKGIQDYRVAVMCSEEPPQACHRSLLIGKVLAQRGVEVLHIRSDGTYQTSEDLEEASRGENREGRQLSLIDQPEEESWRSVKPIPSGSQKGTQRTSLKR